MTSYLRGLTERLRDAGLPPESRMLLAISSGGLVDADDMAQKPILSIGSGPAIIESPVTTVVLEPGAAAERTAGGSLSILPGGAQ